MNLLIGAATIGLILAPLGPRRLHQLPHLPHPRPHRGRLVRRSGRRSSPRCWCGTCLRSRPPRSRTHGRGRGGRRHRRPAYPVPGECAAGGGPDQHRALLGEPLRHGGGNVSLASAESLVTAAERLGRRFLGLPASVTLLGTSVSGGSIAELVAHGAARRGLALALALFMRTDLGWRCAPRGTTRRWPRPSASTWIGWSCSASPSPTGCIALSGALFAQYEGFANIQMGIGAVVTGRGELSWSVRRCWGSARMRTLDRGSGGRGGGLSAARGGRGPSRAQPERAQAGDRAPGAGRAGAAAAWCAGCAERA